VGDRMILAASNTQDWGVNDGNVSVESVNSDVNHHPFSHTRVYQVAAGNHTFYAVAENYVEQDGTGRTSIYASLTVEFFLAIKDDLLGTWDGQGGVWVKYSSTASWSKLSSTARDIDAGNMSGGAGGGGLAGFIKLLAPIGGYTQGPGNILEYEDLSSEGPGGPNFVFQEKGNLVPQEKGLKIMMRIPGPGEPGFKYIEQKNLVPQERIEKK